MKCQNCGKNEVCFHYSSNVNGCMTETHLCSECADRSGFDIGRMFGAESILDDFFPAFPSFGFRGSYLPVLIPVWTEGRGQRTEDRGQRTEGRGQRTEDKGQIMAGCGGQVGECGCDGACSEAGDTQTAEVDCEMQKRREINAVREQMRIAAENEDFEKAAELRDKIRGMES